VNKIKMFSVVMIAGMVFFGAGCGDEEGREQAKKECEDKGGRFINMINYKSNLACDRWN